MLIDPGSRLVPVTSRLLARSGIGRAFHSHFVKTIEHAAAESIYSPGIISLPGESARATGTMAHTTVDEIRKLEAEGEFAHGATLAHRIDGALLADGCVYASRSYKLVTPNAPRRKFLPRHAPEYGEAQLCSDMSSELYFGHWLLDGLCTERLAAERRLTGLVFDSVPSTHKEAYRDICAVAPDRVTYAHVERLWLIDDRGINTSRLARWQSMRAAVRRVAELGSGPRLVYLLRSAGKSSRFVNNGGEVERILERRGFVAVDPMAYDTRTLAGFLGRAAIVVSMEGSHQSHALMAMPAGGTMLTFQPADRFLHSYLFFANAAGIRSAFTVAERRGDAYHIAIDRLERTLDLL